MSNEINILPEGWQKTTLEHLIIRISNGVNVTQHEEKIGLPITRIETIWNGKIDLNRVKYIKEDNDELRLKYGLMNGDILFSHINSDSHLGKTAIFQSQVKCLIHGINLLLIRPSAEISSEYLDYQFQFLRQKGEFVAVAQRAVNQSSINQRQLKAFEFILAPLNEQRRIVAKIEELFSELDKGVESLKTARAKLKVYRQAVLKHAFEGKLTAQWREENKDKLKTPEQLLARIKQEREARYEQQLKEWKAAVKTWEGSGKRGGRPRKPRTPNPTTESSNDLTAESNKLPFGWAWARVGSLFDVVSGATPKRLDQAKGNDVPFYKVSDMNSPGNETRMSTSKIYISESGKNKLGLTAYPRGTVIFPKRGGAILTNKKRILSRPSCFDLNTMGVVNSIASISGEYLWHWFQSLDLAEIYDGSNVPQINNKNVEPLPFPICSIEEQHEVARILEETLTLVDAMEAAIGTELPKAAALRQSILKKAFAGQLVPQDPHDEPASVLLDRIRAERENAVQNSNSKKTKKRKTTA